MQRQPRGHGFKDHHHEHLDCNGITAMKPHLTLLALTLLLLGLYGLGVLIASLSGHPPVTTLGIAIIPVSLVVSIAAFWAAARVFRHSRSA